MGLNPFPQRRARVRLAVEELHARTVPALLTGLEGEFVSDTEVVVATDELAPDDPSIYATGFADFSITSVDELAPADLVAEGELSDFGEVPVYKGEGSDDFVIMPYYRTLTSEVGDSEVSEEVVDEAYNPDSIFWTFGAVDGEVVDVSGEYVGEEYAYEEYTGEEAYNPDSIFWTFGGVSEEYTADETSEHDPVVCYFGGIADSGIVEEPVADGEVVADGDPIPEEWMYFSMGAPDAPVEEAAEVVTFDDVVLEATSEEPAEVVDPLPEEWMYYTFGGGASEEPVAETTDYDPAVCYMAKDEVIEKVAEETSTDDGDEISIFSLDDFVSDDATAETEDVEVTTQVVTEPEAVTPTAPVVEVAKLDVKPIATESYFSLDGDMLHFYFGGGKKKK